MLPILRALRYARPGSDRGLARHPVFTRPSHNGETMRKLISHKLISLLALGLLLSLGLAHAAEDKAKTPQQQKMATCNKAASGKKGDERKQFMSDCLSAKPEAPSAAGSAQQQKMKDCNKQADGMKGDDRKQFMSTCLKK
jgi:psiF repeat